MWFGRGVQEAYDVEAVARYDEWKRKEGFVVYTTSTHPLVSLFAAVVACGILTLLARARGRM